MAPPKVSRILLPPLWLLAFLLAQIALARWQPGAELWGAPWSWAGAPLILAGIALAAGASGLFKRAGTDVVPFKNVTALVVSGPYRFTRNPMYLGMAFLLAGVAVLLGAATPFVAVPLFIAVIQTLFIRHEEDLLERKFGAEYLALKRRVRRWL